MSLRTRLTIYYTAFFAMALLMLGCGVYFAVRSALERNVENDVRAATQQMLTLWQAGKGYNLETIITEDGEVKPLVRGEFARLFSDPLVQVQIFSPQGKMLARASYGTVPQVPLPDAASALGPDEDLLVTEQYQKTRYSSLITPLVAEFGFDHSVYKIAGLLMVTRPMTDVDTTLNLLVVIMLFGAGATLLFSVVAAAMLSRRALLPIAQVTATAQSIVHAEDLGQRVPVPASQDELHRLTVTINDLLTRLEALFVTQRRFVADVSHELRTPLAAMQGNLEVLARSGNSNPAIFDETLTDMRRETARLIRMVNDLLLLAQTDARTPVWVEPVELDTLLLEVYRELRPLAGEASLRIGAEDQVIVHGDRDRLKQALLNLGVNALQHTGAGGSVVLGLEQRDGFACLSVTDTGIGIAAEDLAHIFERFYRVDRARARLRGGAGLGLSIVKRIAEAHNGYATVASIPGEGSTFAIWLPLATPAPGLAPVPAFGSLKFEV